MEIINNLISIGGADMIHIIILLHFMCFAFGIGFITLSWLVYRKNKTSILRNVVIGEILFTIIFLMDSIGIYIRKILVGYTIENIIKILNYVLAAGMIIFLYKIAIDIKKRELYKKADIYIKSIIGVIISAAILFLFSYKYKDLQGVPYLCIIYLLQCILGIVCIKEVKKEKKPEEEKIQLQCLTPREKEVVDYICTGLSNKEIAEKLFISANTVKNHVYNIYKKLNVKNKVDLINLVNKRD